MTTKQITLTGLAQHAVNSGVSSGLEAGATALERLTPLIIRIAALMKRWIAVCAVSAGVIWLILAGSLWSPSLLEAIVLLLVLAVLAAPAAVLVAYRVALLRLTDAPARLRALPGVVIAHTEQVDNALLAARDARAQGSVNVIGAVRQVMGLARSIQQQVEDHTSLLAAGTPVFAFAAVIAALLGVVEVGLAVVLVAWTVIA